jgi:hypothetical protein
MLARLIIGVGVVSLAACAAAPPPASAGAGAALPGTEACVFSQNIQGWEVLDNQTLLIEAPLRRDVYLVKLFAPARNLPFAERVGFQDRDHDGQICQQDEVIVGGPVPDHWPITALRKLTLDEANALRVQYGKPVVKPIGSPAEKAIANPQEKR